MTRILFLFLCLTSFAATAGAAAPSAQFKNSKLVFNQTFNGKPAMRFVSDITVYGMKGKKVNIVIWVEYPKGTRHKVRDSYRNTTGDYMQCSMGNGPQPYETNVWNNFGYYIPIDDLNMYRGKNTYYLYATVNDLNGKCLGRSEYLTFQGTGSDRNPAPLRGNTPPKTTQKNPPSKSTSTTNRLVKEDRTNMANGAYMLTRTYEDGRVINETHAPCFGCHKTGKCAVCHGSGQQYWPGLGCYQACRMCYGKGACTVCNGNGENITTHIRFKDGQTFAYDKNGAPIVIHDNSSSRTKSGSSSSQGRCTRCGGTGVDKSPMYYKDPSGAGANAIPGGNCGYQHVDGSKCPYCGKYAYHVHLKCPYCRYR